MNQWRHEMSSRLFNYALRNYKEKVSRKRVKIPAIRVTQTGYFILNAALVKEIGESPGGFTIQFLYSKSQNSIAIVFNKAENKSVSEKTRWIICGRDFLKKQVESKIDHEKFYPATRILNSKNQEAWSFYLE